MNTTLAPGLRRFTLSELAEEPWRNGGGVTRTLARRDDGAQPLWRISVADVTGSAPFSRFDGLDRQAVLVEGQQVTLCCDRGSWTMKAVGDVARFPGELPVHADMQCHRARLWNVMADRARMRADVQVSSAPQATLAAPGDGALMVLDGELEVWLGDQLCATLRQGDGLLFDAFGTALDLQFKAGHSQWLLTTVKPK